MPPNRLSLFAACPPGLEEITRAELFSLGINHPKPIPGGVEFSGFKSHLYRVNLWSRIASRVLVRLGEFEAKGFDELRRKAAALPWGQFINPHKIVDVRATSHKSKLYHSDAVAERVKLAIGDHFGKSISLPTGKEHLEDPAHNVESNEQVVVRISHDHCTISLDSSGDHLHQRGYRLATAKAPLRETLAAALLHHAGYDSTRPLLDPFCGSGTFTIEAAMMACNIAPGLNRSFAFTQWTNFDKSAWKELLETARGSTHPVSAPIQASDRDTGAVEAAQANAVRAGVAESIQFDVRAISAIQPPSTPGLVIGNLPYGKRMGSDVTDLYAQFGKVMKSKCKGWKVGILGGSMTLAKQTRLPFGEPLWIENGGLKVPFVIAVL
jgi:putative N6-adenine-specific DNA methylase